MENKINKYKSKLEKLIGGKRNRINKLNKKILLGDGTYGCIISPPLKCRGDPKKPIQPDLNGLSELEKRAMIKSHIENLKEYKKTYISKKKGKNKALYGGFIYNSRPNIDAVRYASRRDFNKAIIKKFSIIL
jgi:hypothetical protein